MLELVCQACCRSFQLEKKVVGPQIPCPHCGQAVTLPVPSEEGPPVQETVSYQEGAPAPTPLKNQEPFFQDQGKGNDHSNHQTASFLEPATNNSPSDQEPLSLGDRVTATGSDSALSKSPPSTIFIPGYEILSKLGEGGMGVVYKARQINFKRFVALKMILGGYASERDRIRFQLEGEAIARLRHPHIVQVYEVGEVEGKPFFSLEFLEGGNLDSRLQQNLPTPQEVGELVEKLAQGVHHAHSRGIVHRDLKPQNVLLSDENIPKITDFGLAKFAEENQTELTRTGQVMGTPAYMAPEQAEGRNTEVGPPADVWALGAILYKCLTGQSPFQGKTTRETLRQVIQDDPLSPRKLRQDVPRDLETICLKCLNKEADQRYPSALELAEDLARFSRNEPIQARPIGFLERTTKWVRRSPYQAAAMAIGVAFLCTLVISLFTGWQLALSAATVNEEKAARNAEEKKALELQAQVQEKEQEELQRQARVKDEMVQLFSQLTKSVSQPPAGDADFWKRIEEKTGEALKRFQQNPALVNFPLKASFKELHAQAKRELAQAKQKLQRQVRKQQLEDYNGDAVFFRTQVTGLEREESLERTVEAADKGLTLFQVSIENSNPPLEIEFYEEEEAQFITDLLYELLLIKADSLASMTTDPDEKKDLLKQALQLLNRANLLKPDIVTYSSLIQRAKYLEELEQNEKAAKIRAQAQEIAPSLPSDYFLVGMQHLREEDYAKARKPLSTALRLQPTHYGALYLLSVCDLYEGRWQEAKVRLSRCLEQRPTFLWPHLQRGLAEMQLGNVDAALADFNKVLNSPPDAMAAYVARVNRGVLAMKTRNWTEAIADFEEAIDQQPNTLAGYINLALTHRQKAEVPAWHRESLLLTSHGVFSRLTLEFHQQVRQQKAVAVLDRAIKKRPLVSRLYHERGRLHLKLGHFQQAQEDFARAIALAENNRRVSTLADDLIELSRLLHKAGEHEEALKNYQAVLKFRSDEYIVHRLMAEPLLALGQYHKAGEALERYLQFIPVEVGKKPSPKQAQELTATFKARGLIHSQEKDFREALDSYSLALRLHTDPKTLALRGWTYLVLQAPYLAQKDFTEALNHQPENGDAFLGRANARIKLGQVEEAMADAEEGLRHGPKTPRMLFNAARVYSQIIKEISGSSNPNQVNFTLVFQCEQQAVELLRQALAILPEKDRPAFWRNYIQVDSALNPIRSTKAMKKLAATMTDAGK